MTLNHYKVVVEPDGMRYIQQNIDELDKNPREDCLTIANEGKIYANPGKNSLFKCVSKLTQIKLKSKTFTLDSKNFYSFCHYRS